MTTVAARRSRRAAVLVAIGGVSALVALAGIDVDSGPLPAPVQSRAKDFLPAEFRARRCYRHDAPEFTEEDDHRSLAEVPAVCVCCQF